MSKLFDNLKEVNREPQKKDMRLEIAHDFEKLQKESKAYFFLMKRISDLKDEAHVQCMYHCGEPIGMFWKAKLEAFDDILCIPEEYRRKAVEVQEEENIRSVV